MSVDNIRSEDKTYVHFEAYFISEAGLSDYHISQDVTKHKWRSLVAIIYQPTQEVFEVQKELLMSEWEGARDNKDILLIHR